MLANLLRLVLSPPSNPSQIILLYLHLVLTPSSPSIHPLPIAPTIVIAVLSHPSTPTTILSDALWARVIAVPHGILEVIAISQELELNPLG